MFNYGVFVIILGINIYFYLLWIYSAANCYPNNVLAQCIIDTLYKFFKVKIIHPVEPRPSVMPSQLAIMKTEPNSATKRVERESSQ